MAENHIKKMNRMKYLIFIVIILAIFSLIWFLNRSFLQITISPITAKLTVDNAPISVNRSGVGKVTLSPGVHTVKIEADNYLSVSEDIELKKGKNIKISFSLKEKPEITTIEQNASFLSLGKDANEILYLDGTGKTLFRTTLSKENDKKVIASSEPITSARLSGINEIIWSPNKDLALFRKNDGIYLFDFQKYDFVHQTETLWGKDIGDIAWAPDNSKIAYFYNPPGGEKTLIFGNIANTELTRVANLADYGIDNPFLSWSPDSQYLILVPRNRDYSQDKIYLYDTYSGTLKAVTDLGNQLEAKFSPDSSKIAYSTYSTSQGDSDPFIISVMDKDGGNQKSLTLRTNIGNIAWLDSTTILSAQYSRSSGSETFSIQNLASKVSSETIESAVGKIVNKTEILAEGKIAAFENADGVFAFGLK